MRPRPGVFVDSISHLLVLSTPSHVHLVGLGYAAPEPGAKKEVTFYLTGLSVPTDGVSFTTIRGTLNGRIFLASAPEPVVPASSSGGGGAGASIGGDGCLYELAYQSSEGWFAKKCTLHNLTSGSIVKSVVPSFLRSLAAIPLQEWVVAVEVDTERGLLYTLLRNSTIEMYSLPSSGPGKGFDGTPTKVAKSGDVVRTANMLLPNHPMLKNFRIVEMQVVTVKEGGNSKIGLVAVTSTGVRLYFTHQRRGYYYGVASTPAALELCHVRTPPAPATNHQSIMYGQGGPSTSSNQQLPHESSAANQIPFNSISQARYSAGGLLVAANNLTPDLDVLLVAAPDVSLSIRSIAEGSTTAAAAAGGGGGGGGPGTRPFTEVASTIEVPGRTWDMCEITARPLVSPGAGTALNELATQPTQARREWVILTNMGANVVSRQRPIDTLLDVLESATLSGNGHGEVGVFFESFGRDQSCAMLLAIAAGNSQVSLGNEQQQQQQSAVAPGAAPNGMNGFATSNARNTPASLSDQAKGLFFEGGGRPISIDRGGYGSESSLSSRIVLREPVERLKLSSSSPHSAGAQVASSSSENKIIFSGRHEGLAFYFARVVRPIWKMKITRSAPSPADPNRQTSLLPDSVLSAVQHDLMSLRSFVEQCAFSLTLFRTRFPMFSGG